MKTVLKYYFAFVCTLTVAFVNAQQKKISDGSISYDIVINTGSENPRIADMFDGAVNTVYIKGNKSRTELVSSLGKKSTIIDSKSGEVTVLNEFGDAKYMINMTHEDWMESNAKYDSVKFTFLDEYKTIQGYKCRKATGLLKDGSGFTVYYTEELGAQNNEFQFVNKSLPGLAMEYESAIGKLKVTYTVSKISFNPVPVSKFDIPQSGFRVMTYTESKNLGN